MSSGVTTLPPHAVKLASSSSQLPLRRLLLGHGLLACLLSIVPVPIPVVPDHAAPVASSALRPRNPYHLYSAQNGLRFLLLSAGPLPGTCKSRLATGSPDEVLIVLAVAGRPLYDVVLVYSPTLRPLGFCSAVHGALLTPLQHSFASTSDAAVRSKLRFLPKTSFAPTETPSYRSGCVFKHSAMSNLASRFSYMAPRAPWSL